MKILQFGPEFYELSMQEIITNLPFLDDLPDFSCKEMARIFIRDCIKIAFENRSLHPQKPGWLYRVVKINRLGHDWFAKELLNFLKLRELKKENMLEIEKYV